MPTKGSMKTILTLLVLGLLGISSASSQMNAPLVLERKILLTGVKGKFDHFAIDEAGNRLFAAAPGNKSVEVINLATGKSEQSIGGFGKPHGVVWINASRRLFVADGGKGELDMLTGSPLRIVQRIPL